MRDEQERLVGSNKSLQDGLTSAQSDNSRLMWENQALRSELELSKNALRVAKREAEGKTDSADASERERVLEEQLRAAREENEKRVGDTAQFQQMKRLMQSQSAKIRDLRTTLQRYQPDETKIED
jgi:leucine zipper transcription factor-like protein 1